MTLVVRDHLFVLPEDARYPRSAAKEILCRKTEILSALGFAGSLVFSRLSDAARFAPTFIDIAEQDWTAASYRGIRLYPACIYSICMELGEFISAVSPTLKHHKQIIEKWYREATSYIDYALNLVEASKPIRYVIVQGYFMDCAVLRQIAVNANAEIVALELPFHSGKIAWDDISGICVNKSISKNLYWRHEESVPQALADSCVSRYTDEIREVKRESHATPPLPPPPKGDRPRVLFLGQVYTDSSLLFGLANFRDPIHVIETLIDWCSEHSVELVLKLHPKENGGKNLFNAPLNRITYRKLIESETWKNAQRQGGSRITVDYENAYDTYQLIRDSDLCVTINSQAGLEALLFNKNVILCGAASFSGLGFTWDAVDPKMLQSGLRHFLCEGGGISNSDAVNRYFYIMLEKYFQPRTEKTWWKTCFGANFESFEANRLLPQDRPFVLWGTGTMAANLESWFGRKPAYYVDTDSSRWRDAGELPPVRPPDSLRAAPTNPFVVIATACVEEVSKKLSDMGLTWLKDFA